MNLRTVLLVLATAQVLCAASLTVDQLRELLARQKSAFGADAAVAKKLEEVESKERIDDEALRNLLALAAGPRTQKALRLMASDSLFKPAPPDTANRAPLDPAEQEGLSRTLREYAFHYLHAIPNFVCKATVSRFDDDPALGKYEPGEIWNHLRPRDVSVNLLSVVDGKESYQLQSVHGAPRDIGGGMSSFGEFITVMVAPFVAGSGVETAWEGWDVVAGKRVGVFGYRVPPERSQFTVYAGQEHINAGYKGRFFLDPVSGAVVRVTRQAVNLPRDFPTKRSDTAVDYRAVAIAGKAVFLPSRSVLIADTRQFVVTPGRGGRQEVQLLSKTWHYLNQIQYSEYRKFTADSKLLADDDAAEITTPAQSEKAATPADQLLTPDTAPKLEMPDATVEPSKDPPERRAGAQP